MEQKKAQILQWAQQLFWKHGFRRISIEEICRISQVSKMTFYRHFANKIELAKAVFDKMVIDGNVRFRQLLTQATNSADFIQGLLLLKLESTENISEEFLKDFYSHPESGMKEYVEQKTQTEWRGVLKDLKQAQKKGLFRKDVDLELFYQLIMKIGEIVADENVIKSFKKPQDLITAFAKLMAFGIAAPKEK